MVSLSKEKGLAGKDSKSQDNTNKNKSNNNNSNYNDRSSKAGLLNTTFSQDF